MFAPRSPDPSNMRIYQRDHFRFLRLVCHLSSLIQYGLNCSKMCNARESKYPKEILLHEICLLSNLTSSFIRHITKSTIKNTNYWQQGLHWARKISWIIWSCSPCLMTAFTRLIISRVCERGFYIMQGWRNFFSFVSSNIRTLISISIWLKDNDNLFVLALRLFKDSVEVIMKQSADKEM